MLKDFQTNGFFHIRKRPLKTIDDPTHAHTMFRLGWLADRFNVYKGVQSILVEQYGDDGLLKPIKTILGEVKDRTSEWITYDPLCLLFDLDKTVDPLQAVTDAVSAAKDDRHVLVASMLTIKEDNRTKERLEHFYWNRNSIGTSKQWIDWLESLGYTECRISKADVILYPDLDGVEPIMITAVYTGGLKCTAMK